MHVLTFPLDNAKDFALPLALLHFFVLSSGVCMDSVLVFSLAILALCFMDVILGFSFSFQLLNEKLPLFQLPVLTTTSR